ncbi:hypothetical protein BGY98DRAFT_934701 [Russula aff. rugulosa BPL654]|nr:hypothetical protein BGY98DRAFT_934701 [Russula aff. rugulosa BPL654]
MLDIISRISIPIDKSDDAQRLALIEISIRNQFVIRWATSCAGRGLNAMVDCVLELNLDLVITEKGISDYAQYFFVGANASALRPYASQTTNRTYENQTLERNVGYPALKGQTMTYAILLRGPSKVILNEIVRNLTDAMSIARNVVFNPTLGLPLACKARARAVTGVEAGFFHVPPAHTRAKCKTCEWKTLVGQIQPSKPPSRLFVSYCAWMTSFRRESQQEQGPPPEELAQG